MESSGVARDDSSHTGPTLINAERITFLGKEQWEIALGPESAGIRRTGREGGFAVPKSLARAFVRVVKRSTAGCDVEVERGGKTYKLYTDRDGKESLRVWLEGAGPPPDQQHAGRSGAKRWRSSLYYLVGVAVAGLCFLVPHLIHRYAKAPDRGTIAGNVYSNEFFGLAFTVPDDWHVIGDEEFQELSKTGARHFIFDPGLRRRVEKGSASDKSVMLLAMTRHELGTENNECITFAAADLYRQPRSGKEILEGLSAAFQKGTFVSPDPTGVTSRSVAGRQFHQLDVRVSDPGVGATLHQRYLISVFKGYGLLIVLTTPDREGLDQIESLLTGLEFQRK